MVAEKSNKSVPINMYQNSEFWYKVYVQMSRMYSIMSNGNVTFATFVSSPDVHKNLVNLADRIERGKHYYLLWHYFHSL